MTGTSQIGATPKAQKAHFLKYAQDFILENSQKKFRNSLEKPKRPNFDQCHSAENLKAGEFGIAKYQKMEGTLWCNQKILEKSHSIEKI